FSSRRRHTRFSRDWSSDVCSSDLTFRLAPAVAMATAVLSFMVIPVSPTLGVADMSIGLLFFMAMAGIAVYAVLFGGWSSNNKYRSEERRVGKECRCGW